MKTLSKPNYALARAPHYDEENMKREYIKSLGKQFVFDIVSKVMGISVYEVMATVEVKERKTVNMCKCVRKRLVLDRFGS